VRKVQRPAPPEGLARIAYGKIDEVEEMAAREGA
jgi:hypothetical protein